MPNSFIKSVHKQTGESTKKLDNEYKKVETYAKKKHVSNPYAYATSVVEKMSKYKTKKD